jgi:L-ascorbate metabolism protein UlaG (beta-lactamase superfamily)
MDPKGAALAASYVKARTVVPMHFQTFPLIPGTPEELKAALPAGIAMQVLEPGKATAF